MRKVLRNTISKEDIEKIAEVIERDYPWFKPIFDVAIDRAARLGELPDVERSLFRDPVKVPHNTENFKLVWKSACAKAGFPRLSWHDARHYAIRQMALSGTLSKLWSKSRIYQEIYSKETTCDLAR
jgi:hypothetical protein